MWHTIQKALRAAVILIAHALIACVLIVCTWAVDHLILTLNHGQEMMVYGRLPLSFLFQTIDMAMIGVFGFYGVLEAIRIMRE